MMGKIGIHYDDEVPSCMLHAVDVGSAFERKWEFISSWQKLIEYIRQILSSFKLT